MVFVTWGVWGCRWRSFKNFQRSQLVATIQRLVALDSDSFDTISVMTLPLSTSELSSDAVVTVVVCAGGCGCAFVVFSLCDSVTACQQQTAYRRRCYDLILSYKRSGRDTPPPPAFHFYGLIVISPGPLISPLVPPPVSDVVITSSVSNSMISISGAIYFSFTVRSSIILNPVCRSDPR